MLQVAVLILIISGCNEDKTSPTSDSESCYRGEVIKSVRDQNGRVLYDSTENQYVILVSIPGTYDSVDAGFICDKVAGIEIEKEGITTINFDGEYFPYDRNTVPPIAGTKYYYLKISDFEIIK